MRRKKSCSTLCWKNDLPDLPKSCPAGERTAKQTESFEKWAHFEPEKLRGFLS